MGLMGLTIGSLTLLEDSVEETLISDEYVSLFLISILDMYIWNFNIYVPIGPYGKLESGSLWEVQQVPRIIDKISGSRKMTLDLVRSTEKAGSLAPPPRSSKVAESMYKYLQTHIEVLKLCIIKSANK